MDEPEVVEDKSGYIPKAKKPMSEAQLAALAKARQKAYELRQQKKNVVNIDSSSEEDEEKDTQPKPEPEKPKPRQRKTKPKPPVQKEEAIKEDKREASDEDDTCCMTKNQHIARAHRSPRMWQRHFRRAVDEKNLRRSCTPGDATQRHQKRR